MFAQERAEKIIQLLNENQKVVVKELSKRFDVTEDCIRKDLKTLEKQGIIKRTYGGGVLNRQFAPQDDILRRVNINLEGKIKIAEKAFELIKSGETIFLDISSINILIAEKIAKGNKKLLVITNMIDIIRTFSKCDHVGVIGTGGVFNKEVNGFVGSSAIEYILKHKVNRAFIGSCGVNMFDKSITTYDVEDGNTKKAIISSGKKVYLVIENKKFYYDATYKFAEISDVDFIIVDKIPDDKICSELEKMNIELI
ncbi:DeoR/GlpR family DNA-binding transcription regulator [Clostridium estertheticum]|uniref:DeoR/GlpR family DNA-binding transcription regulator n=1 Tax=Clostridium estertheticum TaxID=238834 RepID=UPI001CF49DDF|nr:DeoR/GlpR family DNA-binding transcription regulator [Clostridium estertheticum]MCB2353193.1 DeoR/GlpR family DNA-binding transcription regulator [Clostridium estertheticum]WAG41547.1 DeoR/GlpR family DNA-binding transcription regulator [Clostridium estertheticum]